MLMLTHDYYIGDVEVTQALGEAVMDTTPIAEGSSHKGADFPVRSISWDDCQHFILWMDGR